MVWRNNKARRHALVLLLRLYSPRTRKGAAQSKGMRGQERSKGGARAVRSSVEALVDVFGGPSATVGLCSHRSGTWRSGGHGSFGGKLTWGERIAWAPTLEAIDGDRWP